MIFWGLGLMPAAARQNGQNFSEFTECLGCGLGLMLMGIFNHRIHGRHRRGLGLGAVVDACGALPRITRISRIGSYVLGCFGWVVLVVFFPAELGLSGPTLPSWGLMLQGFGLLGGGGV